MMTPSRRAVRFRHAQHDETIRRRRSSTRCCAENERSMASTRPHPGCRLEDEDEILHDDTRINDQIPRENAVQLHTFAASPYSSANVSRIV